MIEMIRILVHSSEKIKTPLIDVIQRSIIRWSKETNRMCVCQKNVTSVYAKLRSFCLWILAEGIDEQRRTRYFPKTLRHRKKRKLQRRTEKEGSEVHCLPMNVQYMGTCYKHLVRFQSRCDPASGQDELRDQSFWENFSKMQEVAANGHETYAWPLTA